MKALFVLRSVANFSYQQPVVEALCRRGHTVQLLFDRGASEGYSAEAVDRAVAAHARLSSGWLSRRSDGWRRLAFGCRELGSYSSYLRRTDQSEYYLNRWEQYVSRFVQPLLALPGVKRAIATETTGRLLRTFERLVPTDRQILDDLRARMPDVVVASPVNMRFSEEVEYVKAAKQLGIPTAVPVHSWDNLTTKGLIHVLPDLLLVWNTLQRDEARTVHKVPPEQIVIVGAPFFDKWFEPEQGCSDRATFLRRVGLDPDAPYLLYLGSSANITRDETWLVRELVLALREHGDPALRRMGILIRPHPANARIYEPLSEERVSVWPKEGGLPDSAESLRDFEDSLRFCSAVAGVNTTAMVDAIVADRPVVAVLTDRYAATQTRTVHFQHLLRAGVVETARGPRDVPHVLLGLIAGHDPDREARRRFVHWFVRPRGLDRSAGKLAALAIEAVAERRSPAEIDRMLASDMDSLGRNDTDHWLANRGGGPGTKAAGGPGVQSLAGPRMGNAHATERSFTAGTG